MAESESRQSWKFPTSKPPPEELPSILDRAISIYNKYRVGGCSVAASVEKAASGAGVTEDEIMKELEDRGLLVYI